MNIYKLTIIDENSPHLEAATYIKPLIIRANSEGAARDLAVFTFGIAVERIPFAGVKICPWRLPEVSSCVQVFDSKYSTEGLQEILNVKVED